MIKIWRIKEAKLWGLCYASCPPTNFVLFELCVMMQDLVPSRTSLHRLLIQGLTALSRTSTEATAFTLRPCGEKGRRHHMSFIANSILNQDTCRKLCVHYSWNIKRVCTLSFIVSSFSFLILVQVFIIWEKLNHTIFWWIFKFVQISFGSDETDFLFFWHMKLFCSLPILIFLDWLQCFT